MAEALTVDDIQDIIEQCLEGDDLSSLVRLVFDAPPRSSHPVGVAVHDAHSLTTSGDGADGTMYREDLLEVVMDTLQRMAKEKEALMAATSGTHAAEIAAAVAGVEPLSRRAEVLRSQLHAAMSTLRSLQPAMETHASELARLDTARHHLSEIKEVNVGLWGGGCGFGWLVGGWDRGQAGPD